MPRAVNRTSIPRPDLGEAMESFSLQMDAEGFIGLKVLPVYESRKSSGTLAVVDLKSALKEHDTRRAPGANYKSSDFTYDFITYATEEHGFEVPIDDREEAEVSDWFDAELEAAEFARAVVMRNHEKRVAAAVFNTTTFAPKHVTAVWSSTSTAVPIDDIARGMLAFRAASGKKPNALILNWKVYSWLRQNEQIHERIVSAGAGESIKTDSISEAQIAASLGVSQLIVAGAMKDTANEGLAASFSDIWSDQYAMLAHVAAPGSSFKNRTLGRTIHWGEDGSQIGCRFESYRDEGKRSDIVRQRHDVDEKVIATELGYLFDLTDTTEN